MTTLLKSRRSIKSVREVATPDRLREVPITEEFGWDYQPERELPPLSEEDERWVASRVEPEPDREPEPDDLAGWLKGQIGRWRKIPQTDTGVDLGVIQALESLAGTAAFYRVNTAAELIAYRCRFCREHLDRLVIEQDPKTRSPLARDLHAAAGWLFYVVGHDAAKLAALAILQVAEDADYTDAEDYEQYVDRLDFLKEMHRQSLSVDRDQDQNVDPMTYIGAAG